MKLLRVDPWGDEGPIAVDERRHARAAARSVGGFALVEDLGERGCQLDISGGQRSKVKRCAHFSPLGPCIASQDEIADLQDSRCRSWVNGQHREGLSNAHSALPVAQIVCEFSGGMLLGPADVILGGTHEGVAPPGRFPYLITGDLIRMELEGPDSLELTVAQDEEEA